MRVCTTLALVALIFAVSVSQVSAQTPGIIGTLYWGVGNTACTGAAPSSWISIYNITTGVCTNNSYTSMASYFTGSGSSATAYTVQFSDLACTMPMSYSTMDMGCSGSGTTGVVYGTSAALPALGGANWAVTTSCRNMTMASSTPSTCTSGGAVMCNNGGSLPGVCVKSNWGGSYKAGFTANLMQVGAAFYASPDTSCSTTPVQASLSSTSCWMGSMTAAPSSGNFGLPSNLPTTGYYNYPKNPTCSTASGMAPPTLTLLGSACGIGQSTLTCAASGNSTTQSATWTTFTTSTCKAGTGLTPEVTPSGSCDGNGNSFVCNYVPPAPLSGASSLTSSLVATLFVAIVSLLAARQL